MNTTSPPDPTPAQPAAPSGAGDRLAQIKILTPISIIVPTYGERENLPHLVDRIDEVRNAHALTLELLIMDDMSNDGSAQWAEQCGHDWVRLIERTGPRGLSAAVLDGIEIAQHPIVVVMDADLSHPPERIPDMILALEAGQELIIGSRYVPGGSTDDHWGFLRWFNSFIATLLARPLTKVHDPMAGFFAFRKKELERATKLNPVGYKIGLEIIVKCRMTNVGEVPIQFTDRVHGESKLNFKQQLLYLKHLRRLYIYKFGAWSHLAQFLVVGASGVLVNLVTLYALFFAGLAESAAIAGGILVSLVSNFFLNRRFTFSYARMQSIRRQFVGFVAASSVGMVLNYSVALITLNQFFPETLWLASLCGIAAGTLSNFLMNRYLVFRETSTRNLS